MAGRLNGWRPDPELLSPLGEYRGRLHVGVDLGTAYTVLMVLDADRQPIAGAYQFAQIVRDGLVVDFVGAVELLRQLKQRVEQRLGVPLVAAASAYPPGVPPAEVRATANVLHAAGLECTGLIFNHGRVVYTADEPTGGTHFSLVIAGAKNLTFEQAEALKKDPREQARLFPVIRPVMEKVGSIVRRHVAGHAVEALYLVGGTCAYPGMDKVLEEYTGIRTVLPGSPLFVTPLGIALHN